MKTIQPRRPAGVPTGGQFATKTHPEPGYTLDAADVDGGAATIDGKPAEPAIEAKPYGGRTERYLRYLKPHDPDDGRPAVMSYYPDGTVEIEEHWQRGRRQS